MPKAVDGIIDAIDLLVDDRPAPVHGDVVRADGLFHPVDMVLPDAQRGHRGMTNRVLSARNNRRNT